MVEDNESYPDATALWTSLRDYLTVDVEVFGLPDEPRDNSPVTIRFKVTNTSPTDLDSPEIVFEDVRLHISVRGSTRSPRGPLVLDGGQSFDFEHKCLYRDIATIEPRVEANVSRRRFFHIKRPHTIPIVYTKPIALAYLRSFNGIAIHGVLESTLRSISVPGPDTSLAELQGLLAKLTLDQAELEDILGRIRALPVGDLGVQGTAHGKAAHAYVTKVRTACADIKDAISSTNPAKIAAATGVVAELESDASQVNRLTEQLMDKYDVSDEEVDYSYRER